MALRAIYHKGGEYPQLHVTWEANDELVDLTGKTLSVEIFPFGGSVIVTKTDGFVVPPLVGGEVPDPNLIVAWSVEPDEDLNVLDAGEYVMKFKASDIEGDLEYYGMLVLRENAPNYGYCEIPDLLLGDLKVPASLNKYKYINDAADEMNAQIGQMYVLPLDLSSASEWVISLLKTINAQLATGRLLMAQAQSGQNNELDAYGAHLVESAYKKIKEIVDGSISLGLELAESSFRATAPQVLNRDQRSPVSAFEDLVYGGSYVSPWVPGS